jgi:hypothetical protein
MELDPTIWGPHYWFVLHTIALCYPLTPNDVTKKKYYDFIQNLPLMMPVSRIGDRFSEMLDKYPVTPYLDSRESFIKWMHFIHNKYNLLSGKEEVSMAEAMDKYYHNYKPKNLLIRENLKRRQKILYLIIIALLLGAIWRLYKF